MGPLAFVTDRGLQVRSGDGRVRTLGTLTKGSQVDRPVWSSDGRRLAWTVGICPAGHRQKIHGWSTDAPDLPDEE
jgi:hypothetical protein